MMEREKDKFRNPNRERTRREDSEIEKNLVSVRRVTKVVKGGRTMRFSALVVAGDKKGNVGIATGKASEVPMAVEKATEKAKKNMHKINIVNGTIPHETVGKFSTTTVLMFPAKEGSGLICGGSVRAVVELAGIKDVVTKVHGSTNKINVVKATLNALLTLKTKEEIAAKRGKSVEEI
jgi:small subunit ribosomal protein S5